MISRWANGYIDLILKYPLVCLALLIGLLGSMLPHLDQFKVDASAESLLLEDDPDLKLFREVNKRYDNKSFLILTFTPHQDLWVQETLDVLQRIRDELRQLEIVSGVTSLLDVPLLRQAQDSSLTQLSQNIKTIQDDDIDLAQSKKELLESPIYQDLIINRDGTSTALQINFKQRPEFISLQDKKQRLSKQNLSAEEYLEYQKVSADYRMMKAEIDAQQRENIKKIRDIIQSYSVYGAFYLGGVPMIVDDMVRFIQHDLIYFGVGVLLLLIIILTFIFRHWSWMLLPLANCIYASLLMICLLACLEWDVTVISSNFIALMLIITMSMNIHLLVRYRQWCFEHPEQSRHSCISATMRKMFLPCLYTVVTTIIAFASLVISDIKPVIDFGWMMISGLIILFFTSFTLLPILLMLIAPRRLEQKQAKKAIVYWLARLTEKHGQMLLCGILILFAIGLIGLKLLEVENSFANYFDEDTELSAGLRFIDQNFGGTAPLDILIQFEDSAYATDQGFEDFDLLYGVETSTQKQSWYTLERVDKIKQIHDYLESLPEIGKVLSLASIVRVGEAIYQKPFDEFELAVITQNIPDDLQDLLDDYVSEQDNQTRISARILDTKKDLRRKALLEKIHRDLSTQHQLETDEFKIAGILVLYNNMLQSLFKSQILTLGLVMLGVTLMLYILFRSWTLAVIGIIPNMFAAIMILGIMGLFQIPLDMMTITIAAITIGIAVDNSIHYIYRFREELASCQDYTATMYQCHASIGRSVFYTALTIMSGFSILMLSNFIPTVYFGILTALAMLIAMFAALTLLPKLILILKPFS